MIIFQLINEILMLLVKSSKYLVAIIFVFTNITGITQVENLAQGQTYIQIGELRKADLFFSKVLEETVSQESKSELHYEIAKIYNEEVYYNLSFEHCKKAIEINNNKFQVKRTLQLAAQNYIDIGNLDLAENYYYQSINSIPTNEQITSNDLNLIGEIKRLKGEFRTAIRLFLSTIQKNKKEKSYTDLAMNYNNIGLAYLGLGSIDTATQYLQKSYQIIDSLNLKNYKNAINISFGKLYTSYGQFEQAVPYFLEVISLDLSKHPDKAELLKEAYEGLTICYEKLEDYKKSYDAYKEFQKYSLELLSREAQIKTLENQLKYERESSDHQISMLNFKRESEKKYFQTYILLLLIGVILALIVVYAFFLKIKNTKYKVEQIKSEKELQQLALEKSAALNLVLNATVNEKEREKEIAQLKNQQIKAKLEVNERELVSNTILISNKNQLLLNLNQKLTLLKKGETASLIEMEHLLKENIQFDKDWGIFKKHFTKVHPLFFTSLLESYTDLTNEELKLCAYLKLQLSSKEIARILNVSTEAINKRRNRLRKKLFLNPKDDLYAFLIMLNS